MKTFLTGVLGLSFVLGPAVYAQASGGTGDKSQRTEKVMTKTDKVKAKGGDDKGGKGKGKGKGGDKDNRGKGKGKVTKE
jgi:hypothetical protein